MNTKLIQCKVAGVTFEGRQAVIATLQAGDWYRVVPEPDNPYDPNALAVYAATADGVKHIGYIPKDYARLLAPLMGGEEFTGQIADITGGFENKDGTVASYGVVLQLEVPDAPEGEARQ